MIRRANPNQAREPDPPAGPGPGWSGTRLAVTGTLVVLAWLATCLALRWAF